MTVTITLTLALAALSGQPAAADVKSERYTVEALDTGGDGRAARVIISNHVSSRRHMLSINSTLGALRRSVIRADEGRVLFLCEYGFAVVDPSGQVPADEVYAADPVASPGGRWIAYRRFFPSPHPGPTDGIALYDTRQSPDRNHQAHPIAAEREWRAGWPVFPPPSEWKDASSVVPRSDAYSLSSSLSWEGDESQPVLLFSMRNASEDTVVLAVPRDGEPRACWSRLPGTAERWRVKTLSLANASSAGHQVRVSSAAVGNSDSTTIAFSPDCTGEVP
jgi:hypothetical protein